MSVPLSGTVDLVTSLGVGALAVVGGVAKGSQWKDPKTGAMSIAMMVSGIATALVMATVGDVTLDIP